MLVAGKGCVFHFKGSQFWCNFVYKLKLFQQFKWQYHQILLNTCKYLLKGGQKSNTFMHVSLYTPHLTITTTLFWFLLPPPSGDDPHRSTDHWCWRYTALINETSRLKKRRLECRTTSSVLRMEISSDSVERCVCLRPVQWRWRTHK